LFVPREPALASALLTTTLLTTTLFFTLAPLTLTLFSLSILLLSALLSRGRGFAWFVWILLCVHDAFLSIELIIWVGRTSRLDLFNQIAVEIDSGLKHTIGVLDGYLVRQNPTRHAIT
jgi:hypothetical protein